MDTLQFIEGEFPWLMPSFAFVMGAIVGSFLNVCIYRIPAGKSIVSPGSTCACGQAIAWYDNIPILSWFILRGKARCCGGAYSFRYPFVEALTGFFFLAAWLSHSPLKALCLMLFSAMLVCASFIDFDHMEIPDRFSIGLAAIGFGLSVLVPELHDVARSEFAFASVKAALDSAIGILIGSATILWIALLAEAILRKEAMGFGDVKLLGGIGAFLGWQGAIFSIFGGALLGCIGLLFWSIVKKFRPQTETPSVPATPKTESEDDDQSLERHIPFGPMLSGGALLYAFLLETEVLQYFSQFETLYREISQRL
ncbi:prepilin peptidase [Pelagicoccus sp. SDUM812005]|uniref:prepilin peptidase n=1 Tax=Pelagicoccus sp. SDUM812005 TaxID=3041257 RepID=UPI00280D5ABB|nr:prepilin peptidase [Pelagicoccus sp. SDUM812005]MDQ8179910.1 prepilin peptidase [Pelagicoccus sp. SDUM812005]